MAVTNAAQCSILPDSRTSRWLGVALFLALVVGFLLRILYFQNIPPGFWRDEAFNGMDALRTLQGDIRLFYSENFGREPLFIWLVALSIRVLGVSPIAVRFPSLIAGTLTLFTLYGVAREFFNRRTGVLATAVLAIMIWHIHFSRVGFRAILLPFLASLSIWLVARSLRSGRVGYLIPGGITAGLLIYTYLAARIVILPIALFGLYMWFHRRSVLRALPARLWLLFLIPSILTAAPFLVYALYHWNEVFHRVQTMGTVFTASSPLQMLLYNVLKALGMFLFRGDFRVRHNVPFRPVFDPAMGIMFCLGLWLSIRDFRKNGAMAFILIWIGSFLIPTILTDDCPHFIRAIGMLPFVAILPALGIEWTWDNISRRWGLFYATCVVLLLFAVSLGCTVYDYFIKYPSLPEARYYFESAGVEVASEINAFLEKGWSKGMWVVPDRPGRADRQVYVQFQLWKDFINAHFLIPDSPGFNVPGASEVISVPPRPDLPMVYYGWYNQYNPDFWLPDLHAWMPPHWVVEVYECPWAITAQDPSPHPACLKFVATPMEMPDQVLAELNDGISLVRTCYLAAENRLVIRSIWYAREPIATDFTIFLHYEREGQIVAQADGPPAAGYYPTSKWRPGDFFRDERAVPIPEVHPQDRVWIGMYHLETGERVSVLTALSTTQDNRIMVDMQPCGEK